MEGVRPTRPPNASKLPLIPLAKSDAWARYGASQTLLDDLTFGVYTPVLSTVSQNKRDNYSSISDNLVASLHELDILERECKIETVPNDELSSTIISPLGAVPRKNSDRVRIIHDLSLSVNEHLASRSVSMPTIDDVLPWITRDSWIWKRDWKGGYAQFWVEPSCRRLLGFKHPDGRIMRYKVLTMGACNSAADFCLFSYFIRDVLRSEGITNWAYIDDGFGVAQSQSQATSDFIRVKELYDELYVEEAEHKAAPPSQVAEVLGYEIDTRNMIVRVPEEKVSTLVDLCISFRSRRSASLKEVQSFVGKLTWAAKVVRGGRVFLSRMYHLLFLDGPPHSQVKLSAEFQSDVKWWLRFFRKWNGISLIDRSLHTEVHTDASKTGFGAWEADKFLWGFWSNSESSNHSNWKELNTILIAVRQWGETWRGKRVVVWSDNMPSVAICSRGYTRSPKLAKTMRHLFWAAASFDIDLQVKHIAGINNNFADFLSRQNSPHSSTLQQRVTFADQAPENPALVRPIVPGSSNSSV